MAEKYYRFYEVLNSGTVTKIASAGEASKDAKWIIKEEYYFPCSSYSHNDFSFIDKNGECVCMQISDTMIGKMYVRGVAEDYQLCMEFSDSTGELHTYRLHNDIRYNYPPFIGPKAFSPKYMDWDSQNPVNEIVYYLTELEKLGSETFDEEFEMVAEIRDLTGKYNLLRRNYDIAANAARVIETIEIKEGIETLEPYALEAFSSLKKLVLPATMTELQEYSLYSFSLKEIYCKAQVPPKMKWFVFGENMPYPKLTIYVPVGTAEEYAKAWGFNGKPKDEFTFIEYYE